ncbi:MAG: 2-C-methyl-D-erythritol 4-phosphate cytidylyltransferase [Clostridiales bacterium]|nr:2-C-methyl-D-erythritol 4-phosphate cytidylyltransferase [Clostridiales bacterium]
MSFSHKKLYVIFPAAGSGTRMHSDKNKLLMEVGGVAVIDRTLSAFRSFGEKHGVKLHGILVVTPGKTTEWEEYMKDNDCFSFIEKTVEGGSSRTESVGNGVKALDFLPSDIRPDSDDPVFIHDAARCLIDPDSILRCFEVMNSGTDVCVSGVKTKNTIKMVKPSVYSDGFDPIGVTVCPVVESTPDRSLLYEVQTPQCFRYEVLKNCYEKASSDHIEATDDTALAEYCGYEVRIVEGSYSNIKITTPEDIPMAEALLKS